MRTDRLARAGRHIRALATSAADSSDYRDGVLHALRDVVAWDGGVLMQFDPATLLFTAGTALGVDPGRNPRAIELEFAHDDVDHFADLARDRVGAAVLSRSVDGIMTRSARYRDLLQPEGLHDELRVVCRSGSSCWAGISLTRCSAFTEDERTRLAALGGVVADGLRVMLLRGAATPPPDDRTTGPAVVVLGRDGQLEGGTPYAYELLSQLQNGPRDEFVPVQAIFWRRRASPTGIASVRLRTADGRWLVMQAGPLRLADGVEHTIVTIEPARPPEVVSIVAASLSLTTRETHVLEHLLAGRSSVEIGRAVYISPHTVNDHVRHIFEKAGVHTRAELMASLFFSHYAPRLADPQPPSHAPRTPPRRPGQQPRPA